MEDERDTKPLACVAALEQLTGSSRGVVTWLSASTLDIFLSPEGFFRTSVASPGEPRDDLAARLHPAKDTYEIEASEGQPVWVNGVRVTTRLLEHCDIIEFGETGPMSRFRLYRKDKPVRKTVEVAAQRGVEYLTLFAFSSENWSRPKEEVSRLMALFLEAVQREAKALNSNNVKLEFIGERDQLQSGLMEKIKEA